MKNIILIGMPGSGKSTIGVLLAKQLCYDFVDTDIVIQNMTGQLLYKTLEKVGVAGLLELERDAILSLEFPPNKNFVISTGGSAVLMEQTMTYLKENGICVYLELDYQSICKRVGNFEKRGIAANKNESLLDIYNYRKPFYERYADVTVNCKDKSAQDNLMSILEIVNKL